MGLLNWTNEYVNPWGDSNREREEKQREQAARQQQGLNSPQSQQQGPAANPLAQWIVPTQPTVGDGLTAVQRRVSDQSGRYNLDQATLGATFHTPSGDISVGDYIDKLYASDPGTIEQTQRLLYRGGFFGNAKPEDIPWGVADQGTLAAVSGAALQAARYSVNQGNITIDQVMQQAADARAGMTDAQGNTTTTTSRVDLSTAGDAETSLRAAMTSLLGRAPKAQEVRSFQRRLNAQERANPTIVTSTQVGDDGGAQDDVVQTGGITAGDVASLAEQEVTGRFGEERNRYGIFDYTQAFEQAIGG